MEAHYASRAGVGGSVRSTEIVPLKKNITDNRQYTIPATPSQYTISFLGGPMTPMAPMAPMVPMVPMAAMPPMARMPHEFARRESRSEIKEKKMHVRASIYIYTRRPMGAKAPIGLEIVATSTIDQRASFLPHLSYVSPKPAA